MENFNNKFTIIIPSLNPDDKLMSVVKGVISAGFGHIIVVNDGSDEAHMTPFTEAASCGATVLTHEVNKGKGRALKTAFAYVLDNINDSEGVITIDGDNQHTLPDIIACGNKMHELKNHVILGCRDFSGPDVPARSKFGNNTTKNVFRYLCGLKISDTQTGLRAIPYEYLKTFCEVKGERFEYETNMLLSFHEYDIPYSEVQINTVYINENETSHFNPLVDSIKIYAMIFKFMLSSISSSIVDLVAFQCFTFVFRMFMSKTTALTMSATIAARILSSIYNYTLNKQAVFKSKASLSGSLVRYYTLAVIQVLLSGGLLAGTKLLLGVENDFLTLCCKALIDTILFLISFPIQRKWVFKK